MILEWIVKQIYLLPIRIQLPFLMFKEQKLLGDEAKGFISTYILTQTLNYPFEKGFTGVDIVLANENSSAFNYSEF